MKQTVLLLGMLATGLANAQDYSGKVGVNTETPNATLDVTAKIADGSKIEGLKTPQLTGDALKAMTAMLGEDNDGLVVFVTTPVSTPDASTSVVTLPGHYRFNFKKVDTGLSSVASGPALYAEKSWVRLEPTGLEFIVENNKGGRRLVGADASKYGDIGTLAVDMSYQTGVLGAAFNTNVAAPVPVLEGATGNYSFTANLDNTASGERATAFGYRTVAKGSTSFVAGNSNIAEGDQSVVFGYQNYAKGTNSAAFGQANYAEANNSVAFGNGNNAKGDRSVVFGQNSSVVGANANNSRNSVAMGTGVVITDSPNSLAYGANTKITNSQNAFAGGGGGTEVDTGNSSVALGNVVKVKGHGAVGLGSNVEVNGFNSIAIGANAKTGEFAGSAVSSGVAIGSKAKVTGNNGVAIGLDASAGAGEVAIGSSSTNVILGRLKNESGITEGATCSDSGKIAYSSNNFYGCAGGTWKKLNN